MAEEQKEIEYIVSFLMVRKIKVKALDEIRAELKAARTLKPKERDLVRQYKITDETGRDMFDYCRIDVEWWKDNDLI